MTHGYIKYKTAFSVLSALILALGLAGCVVTHEPSPIPAEDKPIVFTPSTGKGTVENNGTRGAAGHPIESGDNIPSGGSFGVYAYSQVTTTADIEPYTALQNSKVTNDGTGFTYAPVANWPRQTGAKLSFYGYYPWQDQSATQAAGEPAINLATGGTNSPSITINYTTPDDPAKQVDLMWACAGLTTGYESVELVFGHALTRVNFKAKKEDYSEAVIITKITVKDVFTKGTLVVLDEDDVSWSGLNTVTDMELSASNGLRTGYSLTDEMTAVINTGADMLVIPQSVQGMEIHVEATNGGEAFPEPFVFPLRTSPDWYMNKIVTYEITIGADGMLVVANVDDWDTANVNIVYDGQWWLSVTEDTFAFDAAGGAAAFTAATNYDIDDQGYQAGLHIDAAEIEYTGDTGWLTVTGGIDGDLSRNLTLTAQPNTSVLERTAKVKVKAGNMTKILNVTQALSLPPVDPDVITDGGNVQMVTYTGAFWKAGQRAERLISIPVEDAAHTGGWVVQVLEYGAGFTEGDILFASWDGTLPVDTTDPDDPGHYVDGKTYVAGNATTTGTNITFRIGLRTTWDAQQGYTGGQPARYARVVVSFGNDLAYYRVIYIRQGHEADFLMSPGDAGLTTTDAVARTRAVKWLPYNLTTDGDIDNSPYSFQVAKEGGVETKYPSQAGAFWQFTSINRRYAYNPAVATLPGGWNTANAEEWSKEHETCPAGYRRPVGSSSTPVNNEFYQSLLATENIVTGNFMWGYYADGYFDRHAIGPSPNGNVKTAVNSTEAEVGYIGRLFYNPVKGSPSYGASIFFPAAGYRENNTSSTLSDTGTAGHYWSSAVHDIYYGRSMYFIAALVSPYGYGANGRGYSVRCVVDDSEPDAYEVDYGGTHLWMKMTDQPTTMWYLPANVPDYVNEMAVPPLSGTQENPARVGSCAEYVSRDPSKPWRLPTIEEFRNVIRFVEANGGNMSYNFNGGYPQYFTATSADASTVHSITSNRPEGNIVVSKSNTFPSRCVRDY